MKKIDGGGSRQSPAFQATSLEAFQASPPTPPLPSRLHFIDGHRVDSENTESGRETRGSGTRKPHKGLDPLRSPWGVGGVFGGGAFTVNTPPNSLFKNRRESERRGKDRSAAGRPAVHGPPYDIVGGVGCPQRGRLGGQPAGDLSPGQPRLMRQVVCRCVG
ncbi:hypothetical protein CRG98_044675 [Punica granatum]|uniref:Uncharacterized protein n=1 Tax=Punica granatum TaxID=22663 RepID=A0A2I0HTD3_PUNGR|nr:hypothetical protein CRG98_044675 [Punica granatum]